MNLIKEAQHDTFAEEIKVLEKGQQLPVKSSILRLMPMIKDGVLRSSTRLRYAEEIQEETRFPVILPKDHPVTDLVVKYYHEKEGGELFGWLNQLRVEYLVIHPRAHVKSCVNACAECMQTTISKANNYSTDGAFTENTIGEDDEALCELGG